MIKTVLFDLDDTLYEFGPAEQTGRAAIRDYAERVIGVDGEAFMACFVEMLRLQMSLHRDTPGSHSRAIRSQLVCEEMGIPLHHAPVLNDLFWNSYIASMHPFPGIPELFAKIRESGRKIGICTNMTADWQMKKLVQLGLIDQCDFIVSSEEADAERFEATAKKLEGVFAEAARYVPARGFVGNGRQGEECFAIYHGMLPPDDLDAAYGILRKDVIAHDYALSTGIFSTKYLLEILTLRGDASVDGVALPHTGTLIPRWRTAPSVNGAPNLISAKSGSTAAAATIAIIGLVISLFLFILCF